MPEGSGANRYHDIVKEMAKHTAETDGFSLRQRFFFFFFCHPVDWGHSLALCVMGAAHPFPRMNQTEVRAAVLQ